MRYFNLFIPVISITRRNLISVRDGMSFKLKPEKDDYDIRTTINELFEVTFS